MNVMTVMFKDKFFEEGAELPEGYAVGDKVPASQIPCIDWGVEGAALITVLSESVIAIFPLAEVESAIVQLNVGGADAVQSPDAASEDDRESVDAGGEEGAGIVLPFKPDFGDSAESDEGTEA